MSGVFRHALGRLRSVVTEDAHGNDVRSYPGPPVPIYGWSIDALGTAEDVDGREGNVSRWAVRCRGRVDVVASDRLILPTGEVCAIEGAVQYQPGPSPATSHTIVSLKLAEG